MTDTTASHVESAAVHLSEDWVSAIIGVAIFVLALLGLSGVDLLGWAATTKIWTVPSAALVPIGKSYAALGGLPALVLTYLAFLGVLTSAAAVLGANVRRFALAFSAVFWLGYIAWIIGSYAHFAAATPADIAKTGVSWSLRLTPEGGLILALVAGLIVGNFFPNFADLAERGDPSGILREDGHRHPRRRDRHHGRRQTQSGVVRFPAFARGNRRGLSDLLAGCLLHLAQILRLLARGGGAARLGHFNLRRRRGDRHRQRHPRPPGKLPCWSPRSSSSSRSLNFCCCRSSRNTFLAHEPLVAGAGSAWR